MFRGMNSQKFRGCRVRQLWNFLIFALNGEKCEHLLWRLTPDGKIPRCWLVGVITMMLQSRKKILTHDAAWVQNRKLPVYKRAIQFQLNRFTTDKFVDIGSFPYYSHNTAAKLRKILLSWQRNCILLDQENCIGLPSRFLSIAWKVAKRGAWLFQTIRSLDPNFTH